MPFHPFLNNTEGVYQKVLVNGNPVARPFHRPDKITSSDREDPSLEVELANKIVGVPEPDDTEKSEAQNQAEEKSRKTKIVENDTDNELLVDET